jgi:hypothetical protein
MSFDPSIWPTAFQRLPLPRLMTMVGDGAFAKKTGAKCPFCESKGKWSMYEKNGRYYFKCHKPGCVANDPPPDVGHGEIGYLVLRKQLSLDDAKKEFLKLAVPDILEQQERERQQKNVTAAVTPEIEVEEPPVPQPSAPPPGKPPTPPSAPPMEPPDQPANVWDALWRKLVLAPHNKTKLMQQRGFSEELIKTLGFKSNNQSNRIHVESLLNDFPMDLLLHEGIYKDYRGGPRPNPQLLGWGLKRKARKDGEADEWDWTEPILIPYFDDAGTCFYLRPHKGGLSRGHEEDDDDDDDEPSCSSHVYCPFILANCPATIEGTAILTEGEFKGAAVFQCGLPVLCIPGISFVRNLAFRAELLGLLGRFGITDLVVCFDNEIKDDPAYPERYKPNPADRYDTQMWAEYIAIDLAREHFGPNKGRVRIGLLPDNLRENGKADFDSALSYFVRQQRDVTRGTQAARKIFTKLIDDARSHRQARELFPTESRRIIEWKLQRLFYKPLVPSGGDKERSLADRYRAVGETEVAKAYRAIVGCYFHRPKPEKDERKFRVTQATVANKAVEDAKATGVNGSEIRMLKLKAKAAWEYVKGLPEAVSDFTLNCDYKLHTHDQKAIRLVRIRNRNDSGKSDGQLLRLTGAQMSRGPEFMCFCYDTGRACWKGGQRLLSHLCEDMDHQSYMRDIYQINYYGHHPESGLWFFGDCAFGPQGNRIEADKNNIFWHEGIGYQVDASIDERGTTFEQGAPLMLAPHGGSAEGRKVDLGELFHDLCQDMFYTIGGYDGWLMLGLVFAYAASPELFTRFGGHPGIWLAGITSEGKTTIARWLMRIWGFKHLPGIRINKGTTHVAMNRNLAQYSCLPVWFDEYRKSEIDPDKEAVLRGAFDRNSASKGLMDHSNRTRSARLFTTPVVSGESSSSDGATRSRYANIIVSKHRRIGDGAARLLKVLDDSRDYYLVGRLLMESRPKFVEEVAKQISEFMSATDVIKEVPSDRMRLVYAAGYASFKCASELIKGPGFDERSKTMPDFREFLVQHAVQALQDVTSETFLNHFWSDVLSGLQRGKAKRHFFDIRYIERLETGLLKEVTEGDNKSEKVCYIVSKSVFDDYAQDLRARGEAPSLDLGDLRRQMAKEKYWVPSPKAEPRVHRARLNGALQTCWVISLERNGTGNYVFPFAEDLEQILEPNQPDPPEAVSHSDEESANTELLGTGKNGH